MQQDNTPIVLTESLIKKKAMAFLKGYYKFRPRGGGGTIVKYGMRAEGGIIADGYLEFEDVDGSVFSATLEASSSNKRDEVVYKIQHRLLQWDTLAATLLISSIVLIIMRYFDWMEYSSFSLGQLLFISWIILCVVYLALFVSLRLLDRYHYIYAIQQFLNYQVTEQWICIGEDVFPSGSDPYFRQLRKKCIDHGIGLLVINHQLQVTPLFTAKRKSFKANQNNTRFKQIGAVLKNSTQSIPVKNNKGLALMRFSPRFYLQQIVFGISVTFLIVLWYNQYALYMHEQTSAEEIVEEVYIKETNQILEPTAYEIDTVALNQFGHQINYKPQVDDTLNLVYQAWLRSKQKALADSIKLSNKFISTGQLGLDSCSKWKGIGKGYYLIIKGIYEHEREALDNQLFASRLHDNIGVVSATCIHSESNFYYVYLGEPMRDAQSAEQLLQQVNRDENHLLKPVEQRFKLISLP